MTFWFGFSVATALICAFGWATESAEKHDARRAKEYYRERFEREQARRDETEKENKRLRESKGSTE